MGSWSIVEFNWWGDWHKKKPRGFSWMDSMYLTFFLSWISFFSFLFFSFLHHTTYTTYTKKRLACARIVSYRIRTLNALCTYIHPQAFLPVPRLLIERKQANEIRHRSIPSFLNLTYLSYQFNLIGQVSCHFRHVVKEKKSQTGK